MEEFADRHRNAEQTFETGDFLPKDLVKIVLSAECSVAPQVLSYFMTFGSDFEHL